MTTAEETEWESGGSNSEWEDVEEAENVKVERHLLLQYAGLEPPQLDSGARISGVNKRQLKLENKKKRQQKQLEQAKQTYWSIYKGDFELPEAKEELESWRNMLCPKGLALHHPAAAKLLQYATGGCPMPNEHRAKLVKRADMGSSRDRDPHATCFSIEPRPNQVIKNGNSRQSSGSAVQGGVVG